MSQDKTPTPLGTVAYDTDTIAMWLPADKNDPTVPVRCGDVAQLAFNGPGDVVQAVMMFSPKSPTTQPSPFAGVSPVTLTPASTNNGGPAPDYFTMPEIIAVSGTWNFSISFMANQSQSDESKNTASQANAFYFLPDPELSVGPGTGEPGQG